MKRYCGPVSTFSISVRCRWSSYQILGIGDQGVGAVLISVAKLVLATLCAGIHPSRQIPVVLDCGTDVIRHFHDCLQCPTNVKLQNKDLLNDKLYLGLRRPRVRGEEYDVCVEKFVETVRKRCPRACIHLLVYILSIHS